jgi:hypothetical protein
MTAAMLWLAGVETAQAQIPEELDNPKITIEYQEPRTSYFMAIYKRMKARKSLERLKKFLAPLRLERTLAIEVRQCGAQEPSGELNAWYSSGRITFCYQFINLFERLAPSVVTDEGLTPEDAIQGAFVGVMFHELGHAVIDLFRVPVFGREEDAADQLAAFILMQFGPNVARQAILAQAHMWREASTMSSSTNYADEHGTDLQRYYNFLCLGYGGLPDTFQDLVAKKILPERRARNCKREYDAVRSAFRQTIVPHLDMNLVKVVQSIDWLRQ